MISSRREPLLVGRKRIQGGVGVVLLADLGEQLEARAAVLVAVLHADLGEDAGHGLGADAPVDRCDRAVTAGRRPGVGVLLLRSASAEQSCAGKLLDADGEAVVDFAGLDRHDGGPQRGGAGCARVRDVVDGDAGLADLLLKLLSDTGTRVHQVACREHADVRHGDARVGQRARGGLRRQVDGVVVGVLAELGHLDSEDPDLVARAHRWCSFVIGELVVAGCQPTGSKPNPIASVPSASVPID